MNVKQNAVARFAAVPFRNEPLSSALPPRAAIVGHLWLFGFLAVVLAARELAVSADSASGDPLLLATLIGGAVSLATATALRRCFVVRDR